MNYRLLKYSLFTNPMINNLYKIADQSLFYLSVENIMSNYLVVFNNIFVFCKNHLTTQAIITLVERLSKALDTGKILVRMYLDLLKAFDTIDHQIVFKMLYANGIRGKIHNWFKKRLK